MDLKTPDSTDLHPISRGKGAFDGIKGDFDNEFYIVSTDLFEILA